MKVQALALSGALKRIPETEGCPGLLLQAQGGTAKIWWNGINKNDTVPTYGILLADGKMLHLSNADCQDVWATGSGVLVAMPTRGPIAMS